MCKTAQDLDLQLLFHCCHLVLKLLGIINQLHSEVQ
jgi:hypothetical protein